MDNSLLKNPAFLRYWLGQTATNLAGQMLMVAIGWQIYALTHSAWDLGLLGLVQFVPQLALTLVAGQVADRVDRRRIIIACQTLECITAAVLAYTTYSASITPEIVFACAFLLGVARAFESTTMQALLPMLLESQHLSRAIAWSAVLRNLATTLGPPLGGLIYIFGAEVVYATGSACYFAAATLFFAIDMPKVVAPQREPVTLKSVFGGIVYIRNHPVILGAISLDLFAVLLGGATALLPIYASDILHIGPVGLGLLRGAPAIGAVLASIYLARRPLKRAVGRVMFTSVVVFGIATIVFGLSHSFALSMASLIVLGAADAVSVVIRMTLVQLETPEHMRGRVAAVNSIFIGTSNQLGQFESGVTAALFGTVPAVVIGGIGTLLVVATWMRLFPMLTNRQQLTTGAHEVTDHKSKS